MRFSPRALCRCSKPPSKTSRGSIIATCHQCKRTEPPRHLAILAAKARTRRERHLLKPGSTSRRNVSRALLVFPSSTGGAGAAASAGPGEALEPGCDECRSVARRFAHEREQVALGVAEESHPQIVIRQAGDHVRPAFERHAAGSEGSIGDVDVIDAVVDDRGWVIELGLLGDAQSLTPPQSKKARLGTSKRNFMPSMSR